MPSVTEAIKWSWKIYKENFLFFIGVVLIFFGFSVVNGFLRGALQPQLGSAVGLIGLIFWLIHVLMELGYLSIALKFVDSKTPEISELFTHYPLFLNFLLTSLLSGLILLCGFVLLIIPGIYLLLRLQFAAMFVVDRAMGPIDSIKGSWNLTKGHLRKILLFDLAFVFLNILGAILLGIGLAVTLPITTLSYVYIYRKLA